MGSTATAIRSIALSFLAVSLPISIASGGTSPSKTYRDPVHKFSLRVFPDWEQVPPKAGQETEVLKFYDPANKGDMWPPELTVVKLPKGEKALESFTGPWIDDLTEEQRKNLIASYRKRSVWDYTMARLVVPKGQAEPDRKTFKKIRSADKVNGKIWTAKICHIPKDRNATVFATLISFEKDDVEYGLYMMCTELRKKKFEKQFRTIARSFRFFDGKAKDVRSVDVLKDVNISAKRRKEIEEGLVKGWDVIVSPGRNYIVIYNTKNNKNKDLARLIADRIEKIRAQIYEMQFPALRKIEAVSVVRVCKDAEEYYQYGGRRGTAGYWSWPTEELVFFDASPKKKIDDDTIAVLYHEAFHQYIFYSVGNVSPHTWFNEGHGDYYSGARYRGGRFKIEPFKWRVSTIKDAIRTGPRTFVVAADEKSGKEERKWTDKGYTPLPELLEFSQREYYAYAGVSYAQGWSLVYFLREKVPAKKEYREKWGHILDTYFDTLKAEVADAELDGYNPQLEKTITAVALEKAFEGVDVGELQEAWLKSTLSVKG